MNERKWTKYYEFLGTMKVFDKCSVLIIPKDCMFSDPLMPNLGHYCIGSIVNEKGLL